MKYCERSKTGWSDSGIFLNIYIDLIIEHLSHLNLECKLGVNTVNIMAYADDIILFSPSVKYLQFLMDFLMTIY